MDYVYELKKTKRFPITFEGHKVGHRQSVFRAKEEDIKQITTRKIYQSTHLALDKMATISPATFSNAFTQVKIYLFRLKFH